VKEDPFPSHYLISLKICCDSFRKVTLWINRTFYWWTSLYILSQAEHESTVLSLKQPYRMANDDDKQSS